MAAKMTAILKSHWSRSHSFKNPHTGIILEISSLSSKLGKIRYLEDFRPEECDSDKCDLKMAAIAAIMAFWWPSYKWLPK
jgi:hypothetical protein